MRNNQGFTLVEIIAVLVILGILAAVAVPKFMNLSDTARNKSASAALAEGISRCNQEFSKQLMAGSTPTNATILKAITGSETGAGNGANDLFNADDTVSDYNGSFSIVDGVITITVNKVQKTKIDDLSKKWVLPSS